eukprot:TRINITY_DN49192_c0_g1_i1.p1 TRINITY_DN49192_c0_g1~~TRINITY_DN49192_c0_g1_i1.p1  ORF type:complete len:125 (+),score=20.05 TRINITY_DN49192_c0_g1_i1:36-377(+)
MAVDSTSVTESIPKGKYEGKAGGLNMVLDFTDSSHVDFAINPYTGSPSSCDQLSYTYEAVTNQISIVSNDAWELAWRKQGVNPRYGDVKFAYRPEENSIVFMQDSVTSFLTAC